MKHAICQTCETVKHCSKHGCIPITAEPQAEADRDYAQWVSAFTKQHGRLPTVLDAWRRADQARRVCSEAYQAVGSMLNDLDQFGTARGVKILDNLSQMRMVHDDVLPWPSFGPGTGDAGQHGKRGPD